MEDLGRAVQELLKEFEGVQFDFNFGSGAFVVAAYIFMSLGLFTIAQNRRIPNPWLAWIPVANLWLLGCISDQYRYVTKAEQRNRRMRLLILGILEVVAIPLAVVMFILYAVGVSAGAAALDTMPVVLILLLVALFAFLFALVVGVVVLFVLLQVQRFKAYCDLFASCVPQQKTLYSTLSIIAGCAGIDLVAAILIFTCRNKEEGMPPRITE